MAVPGLNRRRAREKNRRDGAEMAGRPPKYLATKGRKLTLVVSVWVLAVVSVAVFLFARSHPDEGQPPTSQGQPPTSQGQPPTSQGQPPTSQGQPPTSRGLAPAAAVTSLTRRLYVDPYSQAATWAKANQGSPEAKAVQQRIADQPTAMWLGAWSGDITQAVDEYTTAAAEANKVPVFVAYNLPGRDCGGQSAGGAANADAYNAWIDGLAAGLKDRRALVVLEPDSLAMLNDCLDSAGQQARLGMLRRAVDKLESDNVWVYLDGGHSNWVPADQMAQRLKEAGIARAHGFALNVANYNPTSSEVVYGQQIDQTLGMSKPFVVDTSRNGNGSNNGQWCNPPGSMIGAPPEGGTSGAEMLLWLKPPGESDGDCGAGKGTQAGQFSPQLAQQLLTGG